MCFSVYSVGSVANSSAVSVFAANDVDDRWTGV